MRIATERKHNSEEFILYPVSGLLKEGDGYHIVIQGPHGFYIIPAYTTVGAPGREDEEFGFVTGVAFPTHNVLFPIHPSVTRANVEGARHLIDTGTHWLFSHATPAEHDALAVQVEDTVLARFGTFVSTAFVKYLEATNAVVQAAAMKRIVALRLFAATVKTEAGRLARTETLGHWHRNNEQDHHRSIVAQATRNVLATWKADGLNDATVREQRGLVKPDADALITEMTTVHAIHLISTAEIVRYASAASQPTAPAASVETPVSPWTHETAPDATETNGVYKLVGVRTYHTGVFKSAVWTVSKEADPVTPAGNGG